MPGRNDQAPFQDRKALKSIYDARLPAYEKTLSELYRAVRAMLEARGYTPTIKYRVKRFKNYFGKLQKSGTLTRPGETPLISDLLGLRIISPFLEDLEIVEALLADHFEVVETERKGAQNSFREFGYDSVHLLIKLKSPVIADPIPYTAGVCEIQLRTILQDAWAEVEHELVYKSDIALPNESIKRKLASLNASLTLSDLIFQEIRDYQKEIRQRGRKRRESVECFLFGEELITLDHRDENLSATTTSPETVVGSQTSDLEKTMLSALNAHSQNNFETAIAHYDRLLEMELEQKIRAMVYNHRGMAHFSLGNFDQACSDFSRSLQDDGRCLRSWVNRGLVHRVLKQYEDSLSDYTQALGIDPNNYEGYFGRAQTYCEIQLLTKALADCERALEIHPDYAPARRLECLIRQGFFACAQNNAGPSAGPGPAGPKMA